MEAGGAILSVHVGSHGQPLVYSATRQVRLLGKRILMSSSPKGPLRLGFPIEGVERWFPALYPGTGR